MSSQVLRVNRIMAPIRVLGPGSRIVIWTQGCPLACPGCASQDTWDPSGGTEIAIKTLAKLLVETIKTQHLDGLTITGGEPTEQAAELSWLLELLSAECPDVDILLFTGRSWKAASSKARKLLRQVNCVVSGPYKQELPPASRLQITNNQEIHYRDPHVRIKYEEWMLNEDIPELEVSIYNHDIFLVGMPQAGSLSLYQEQLAEHGISVEEVTWSK